ncbi:MAG: hypothetical protein L6R28_16440 [Planctomycetes bacterium]|nr:hypothetical protein [Planctomycetota bacterium]
MFTLRLSLLIPALACCAAALHAEDALPANKDKPARGMETGGWSLEPWGNPGTADKLKDGDRAVLKLLYTKGEKDKTAFKHFTGTSADPKGKLRMWVYAPDEKAPSVAVALSTSPAYVWFESRAFKLKQGWNKIEVPLEKSHWKSEKTGWTYATGVEHLDQIRGVDVLVFNGQAEGHLLLEGLALDPDETARKVGELIKELYSEESEKRTAAEKALVEIGRPAIEALFQVRASNPPSSVLLRAGWAIKQIEAKEEAPPADPQVREQVEKQKEEIFFDEAKARVDFAFSALKNEQARILKALTDAEEALKRGRDEAAQLKNTEEADQKAFLAKLDDLERLAKEVSAAMEGAKPKTGEKKEEKTAEKKEALKPAERQDVPAKTEKAEKSAKNEQPEKTEAAQTRSTEPKDTMTEPMKKEGSEKE